MNNLKAIAEVDIDRNSNVSSFPISFSMLAKEPKVLQTSSEKESCPDTLYSKVKMKMMTIL